MHASVYLASAAAALAAAQSALTFDCSVMEDVCSHMCWGAYCTTPLVGATLNYDAPSSSTEAARRTTAGCLPSPNRCSTKSGYKEGYNCDEYPFASTSQSDAGGQTNQCVISGDNSRQGGAIAAYTRNQCGGDPCQFTIAFGNADGVQYCDAASGDQGSCVNNGLIYENGEPAPNPAGASSKRDVAAPLGVRFLLGSGMTVILPPHFEVGQVTKRAVPGNGTAEAAELDWAFVDDHIVARL